MSLALGFAHPDELLQRLTSRQLAEWKAFAAIEDLGESRADMRAGMICATIANVHRDPKRSEPFDPFMFMPAMALDRRPKAAEQSIAEMENALLARLFPQSGGGATE